MSRRRRRRRKRRNPAGRLIALVLTLVVAGGAAAGGIWYYAEHSGNPLTEYADEKYNADLYRAEPFSETLCVSAENVALDGFTDEPSLHAAGQTPTIKHTSIASLQMNLPCMRQDFLI